MVGHQDLDAIWNRCFELAWQAHLEGSNPIAALVVDSNGEVVASGKSAVRGDVSDVFVSHREIAHAEVNALLELDNRVHKQVSDYTLYVTLEPCPVCFGAFYMSGIRNLRFAAKDKFGGSTNLFGSTPYLSRKPIRMEGPFDDIGRLSIFLNVYCDLAMSRDFGGIHDEFAHDYPDVVDIATRLGQGDRLGISQQRDFSKVRKRIMDALREPKVR